MLDQVPIRSIRSGTRVQVRDAFGQGLQRVATGPFDRGYDFAVVWACRPEEWEAAQAEGREPDATPWPIEDVTMSWPLNEKRPCRGG
jgi:hypothetical protein